MIYRKPYALLIYLSDNVQAYLGNFYKFCEDLGGVTAEVMCPILQVGHMLYLNEKSFLPSVMGFGER